MSALNTVTALRQAEGNLVSAIDAATAAVEQVGTDNLTLALGRFEDAVRAAKARLAAAVAFMGDVIAEAVADVETTAQTVADDAAPQVAEPTPEARPIPQVSARFDGDATEETLSQRAAVTAEYPRLPAGDGDVIDLADYQPPKATVAANPPVQTPTTAPKARRRAGR